MRHAFAKLRVFSYADDDSVKSLTQAVEKVGRGSVPKDVKEAFKEVLNTTKADTPLGALLRLGCPLDKGSGIRIMIYHITKASDQMDTPEQRQAVQNFACFF